MRKEWARETSWELLYVNKVATSEKKSELMGLLGKNYRNKRKRMSGRRSWFLGLQRNQEVYAFGKDITFGPWREQFQ